MNTEAMLLAQVKAYLILAKGLKSGYYLNRAKTTMELFYVERRNKTTEYRAA
jgi:hypothetical protein